MIFTPLCDFRNVVTSWMLWALPTMMCADLCLFCFKCRQTFKRVAKLAILWLNWDKKFTICSQLLLQFVMDKDHSIFKLTERLLGARACHSSLCPILEISGGTGNNNCPLRVVIPPADHRNTAERRDIMGIDILPCSYKTVSWNLSDFALWSVYKDRETQYEIKQTITILPRCPRVKYSNSCSLKSLCWHRMRHIIRPRETLW